MATKKNTKVNNSVSDEKIKSVSDDSVDNAINDSTATVDDVEDNDTLVEQESDTAVSYCTTRPHRKPPIIRVKRVENKDLEATLQEVGYRNVAQILVEPSLGFALFDIIYWESNDED